MSIKEINLKRSQMMFRVLEAELEGIMWEQDEAMLAYGKEQAEMIEAGITDVRSLGVYARICYETYKKVNG